MVAVSVDALPRVQGRLVGDVRDDHVVHVLTEGASLQTQHRCSESHLFTESILSVSIEAKRTNSVDGTVASLVFVTAAFFVSAVSLAYGPHTLGSCLGLGLCLCWHG